MTQFNPICPFEEWWSYVNEPYESEPITVKQADVTLHISKQKQSAIRALPAETQQRLLDGQRSTLEQIVYETATQKLITIWAVDLCAADMDYIFANEVRQLQAKEKTS